MARPRGRRTAPKLCIVKGCGREIDRWKRLCGSCWRRLPFATRQAIGTAMSDRAPHIVASLSIEAARNLEQHSPAAEAARRLGERDE